MSALNMDMRHTEILIVLTDKNAQWCKCFPNGKGLLNITIFSQLVESWPDDGWSMSLLNDTLRLGSRQGIYKQANQTWYYNSCMVAQRWSNIRFADLSPCIRIPKIQKIFRPIV